MSDTPRARTTNRRITTVENARYEREIGNDCACPCHIPPHTYWYGKPCCESLHGAVVSDE